jgi:hypothetical protein
MKEFFIEFFKTHEHYGPSFFGLSVSLFTTSVLYIVAFNLHKNRKHVNEERRKRNLLFYYTLMDLNLAQFNRMKEVEKWLRIHSELKSLLNKSNNEKESQHKSESQ